MITRNDVLEKASIDCLKELYSKVQPAVDWDDFMQQNKEYSKKYKKWEELIRKGENITVTSFCGPRPYEFYYLPKDIMKEIADSYVRAYNIDSHQELLDIIDILKNYCKDPIVNRWIERNGDEPGYRGYDHPDNLEKEIKEILGDVAEDNEYYQHKLQDKFFEFLDMAGQFYSWNRDLNAFNTTVYLGPSPCSNKETVINNWKQYRNQDIKIDESIYIEEEN